MRERETEKECVREGDSMHEKLQLCDKRRERKRESVCEREITGAGIFCCVCGRENLNPHVIADREIEKEREGMRESLCVCVCVCLHVYVCVCVCACLF